MGAVLVKFYDELLNVLSFVILYIIYKPLFILLYFAAIGPDLTLITFKCESLV